MIEDWILKSSIIIPSPSLVFTDLFVQQANSLTFLLNFYFSVKASNVIYNYNYSVVR